jgi:hypothetical protein
MTNHALSFLAAVALAAVPAAAQKAPVPRAVPAHSNQQRVVETLLKARIANINARIDRLRYEGAIGSAEAQELLKQSRRLQGRLHGLGSRQVADVEFAIDRLESRVAFETDDARWASRERRRGLEGRLDAGDRYERFGRYNANRNGDYEHFDRYTGSSVDRWHDPFDRGN